MCSYLAVFSMCAAYLKCKYSDSPLYSRGSYCSITACPSFLFSSPPHYNRLRPMIVAFLWITFTMVLCAISCFLYYTGQTSLIVEKFISNNNLNSRHLWKLYIRGEQTWNDFFFFNNVKVWIILERELFTRCLVVSLEEKAINIGK